MTRIYHRAHHDLPYSVHWGDYRDILPTLDRGDDGKVCDAVITDPPYSAKTHEGAEQSGRADGAAITTIDYAAWSGLEARELIRYADDVARGWIAVFCDDELAPEYKDAARIRGRYVFPWLPCLANSVRMDGVGPPSAAIYLCVSKPRTRATNRSGLPGWYSYTRARAVEIAGESIRGLKPVDLMRSIVRDYSDPGDVVLDVCAGTGTTGIACIQEGRGAILIERDKGRAEYCAARMDEEIEAIHRAPELWPVRRGQLRLGVSK